MNQDPDGSAFAYWAIALMTATFATFLIFGLR